MIATDWLDQLGFLLVALFTLGCALGVILARRVLHAALWLLPTLVGVAGAFALMGAHVLFAMQLIVYVGAIMVLIVFGVMLLEGEAEERLPTFLVYRVPIRFKSLSNFVLHYYSGMQHMLGGVVAAGLMFVTILAAVAEVVDVQKDAQEHTGQLEHERRAAQRGDAVGHLAQQIGEGSERFLDGAK